MPAHPEVLTSKPEWQTLKEQRQRLDGVLMKDLFNQDPGRAKRYFIEGAGLSLDFSKNRITDDVLDALLALASSCNLEARREALLSGKRVNVTEDRPALHTALRNPGTDAITVDGETWSPRCSAPCNAWKPWWMRCWANTAPGTPANLSPMW